MFHDNARIVLAYPKPIAQQWTKAMNPLLKEERRGL